MTELPGVIQDFSHHQLVVQNRSARTIAQYQNDLHLFCRFLRATREGLPTEGEDFDNMEVKTLTAADFAAVTTSELLAFFSFTVGGRENNARTRARKLSALRTFFGYLKKQHYIEVNPAEGIDSPKLRASLPKYLTLEEAQTLLKTAKNDTSDRFRQRDFCILTLFLNCGMRLSELCGISLSDIDRDFRSLRVLGKGAKERIVYLNPACVEAIRAYLPVRDPNGEAKGPDRNALFLSGQHKRINQRSVQHMVEKKLNEAGLGYRKLSVHKLRHTAATLMYREGGVDVLMLKEILGHEQLSTTQIYTHVRNEDMEKAMLKNPLSGVDGGEKDDE